MIDYVTFKKIEILRNYFNGVCFVKVMNMREPPIPPKQTPGATLDSRLSSLQERYRQHQEAMRNLAPSDRSRRDSTASRQNDAPVNIKLFYS